MDLKNKKVLVLGLARSGLAAIELLYSQGANITLNESKTVEEIPEAQKLKDMGVRLVLGGQPKELFEEDFDLVIKNPGIPYRKWFILRLKERHIPVYTEVELAYQLARPQHYLAITGTNGKTTTASLLYALVKTAYPASLAGNIGVPYSEVVLKENLLKESGHAVVLELSNFQLLDIDQFHPEVAAITNLSPDHLDYMASLDEYYRSKMRIYENMGARDFLVVNGDDEVLKQYLQSNPPKCQIAAFSLEHEADMMLQGDQLVYHHQPVMKTSDIQLVGPKNIMNVMTALLMGHALGLDFQAMADVVRGFQAVEHRIEFVRELDGVKYYNDSKATNTDATIVALDSFSCPVILLIGGKDKGLAMDPLKPHLKHVRMIIGYGACGQRLLNDLNFPESAYVPDLTRAVQLAKESAVFGDVVLLSPTTSSYDQFDNYEQRGRAFKSIVMSL